MSITLINDIRMLYHPNHIVYVCYGYICKVTPLQTYDTRCKVYAIHCNGC